MGAKGLWCKYEHHRHDTEGFCDLTFDRKVFNQFAEHQIESAYGN